MGIPSIQDRLLDDRPLLICQFLCHVTKLETERAQEKEKGLGLYVYMGGLRQIPAHNSMWFAWVTFWPDTDVWAPN